MLRFIGAVTQYGVLSADFTIKILNQVLEHAREDLAQRRNNFQSDLAIESVLMCLLVADDKLKTSSHYQDFMTKL